MRCTCTCTRSLDLPDVPFKCSTCGGWVGRRSWHTRLSRAVGWILCWCGFHRWGPIGIAVRNPFRSVVEFSFGPEFFTERCSRPGCDCVR